jgi:hypothetical protein
MHGLDKNDPRLVAQIVQAELRLPGVESEPPAETSARYRKTGIPKVLALAGVIVGFALLIIPGIVALRSYRRWQDQVGLEPRAAWSVLALGLGVGVGAALWQRSTPLAAVVGVVVFVVGLSLASP